MAKALKKNPAKPPGTEGQRKLHGPTSQSTTLRSLKIRPLQAANWPEITKLFGDKGACGGCWCMYWRVERGGRAWDSMRGDPARRRLHDLVCGGKVHGLLAFEDCTPVGWVCVGPYSDFPRLERVKALKWERPARTWSIVCFYIPSRRRRMGIGTRLLAAARDLAFSKGAARVEGYPVSVHGGKWLPGAFAWTGVAAMFEKCGFARLGDKSLSRHIWVCNEPTKCR